MSHQTVLSVEVHFSSSLLLRFFRLLLLLATRSVSQLIEAAIHCSFIHGASSFDTGTNVDHSKHHQNVTATIGKNTHSRIGGCVVFARLGTSSTEYCQAVKSNEKSVSRTGYSISRDSCERS
jgi:hypothetical protein